MGTHAIYEPVSLACVLPNLFPRVALYTETHGKYVLYKEASLPFTEADRDRLLDSNTLTLFIRTGDAEEVARFTEENLSHILERSDMDRSAKCAALTQATTTYLKSIFADPEKAQDAERCRNLSGHLARYISESQSIADLIKTLEGGSAFAIRHSLQVAVMSMLVWSKLFPEKGDELVDVGIAGMLHDIGMSLILKDITKEQDYWTSPTLEEIKRHPLEGYVFLRKNGRYGDLVLDAVRHHHERYFGGGYPGGLQGDEIKISTQVIGLADMYCTLVTDRPTRKASTPEEAFKIIGDETHRCFSTILFYAFQAAIR